MEDQITIEEQEREYEAQLNQDRAEENQQRKRVQNKTIADHSEPSNWMLGIVMLMFAAPADLLGLIPIVGPLLFSGPMTGILLLIDRIGKNPKINRPVPSNIALVWIMFFKKSKTKQKSSIGSAKFKK